MLVTKLQEACINSGSSKEASEWLNAVTKWLFDNLRNSPAIKDSFFHRTFTQMAIDVRRSWLGYLVTDSYLVEMFIGDALPTVTNVSVLSNGKDTDVLPLALAMDLDYDGRLTATIKMETVLGAECWIQAQVMNVEGRMLFIFKDKYYYYGFHNLERLRFTARVCLAGREWRWLNCLLSDYFLPYLFKRKHLWPNMRSKWLMDKPAG